MNNLDVSLIGCLSFVIIALSVIVAYGELSFETTIENNVLTISGFSDDEFVGVALKQNGMLLDTGRATLSNGQFIMQMDIDYEPGTYELLVGTSDNHQTIEIIIESQAQNIEEEVVDTPYVGNVAPLIEQQVIETPVKEIPSWVRGVFEMWTLGQISDVELIEGIKYLISIGVIEV